MARIDGILALLKKQGGTELRMAAEQAPRMTRDGAPVTFTMPTTSARALRDMVGDLLTEEQTSELDGGAEVVFSYGSRGHGTFWLKLYQHPERGLQLAVWPGDNAPEVDDGPAPTPDAVRTAPSVAPAPKPSPAAAPPPPPPPAPAAPTPPRAALAVEPEPDLPAPVPGQRLTRLLYLAASQGASDLHIADDEPPMVRLAGQLKPLGDNGAVDCEELLAELLTPPVRDRLKRASVDMGFEVPTVGRFRANLYRFAGGLAGAFRVLRRSAPPLGRLNLPVPLEPLLALPHGLIIVCGPTGSGKSTTIASLMQRRLQTRPGMLITLEDPIEYTFDAGPGSLVRQRQIGTHCQDFALGLRDALREDPDNLLIGEMRDPETITLAMTASETGHLVMTSLHSRSAASAVERIVDAYPAERQRQVRTQLADVLEAVVVQRLVPRAKGGGRIPALEVLRGTHNVANIIREGKSSQLSSAIQAGRAEGMLSLERCLADLLHQKAITRETAQRAANDPDTLRNYLRH